MKERTDFLKKPWVALLLRHLALFCGMLVLLWALGAVLGSVCPARLLLRSADALRAAAPQVPILNLLPSADAPIFSYACPFCGMTRAHLAALRLDFAGALAMHPLFFLGLPYLFLLFHDRLFSGRAKVLRMVLIGIFTLLLVAVWLYRAFF